MGPYLLTHLSWQYRPAITSTMSTFLADVCFIWLDCWWRVFYGFCFCFACSVFFLFWNMAVLLQSTEAVLCSYWCKIIQILFHQQFPFWALFSLLLSVVWGDMEFKPHAVLYSISSAGLWQLWQATVCWDSTWVRTALMTAYLWPSDVNVHQAPELTHTKHW